MVRSFLSASASGRPPAPAFPSSGADRRR